MADGRWQMGKEERVPGTPIFATPGKSGCIERRAM